MVPGALVKNVQVITLAVIVFATVLKTAKCEECHQYIKTDEVSKDPHVSSPNFPNLYPSNSYCTWEFENPPNCTFKLLFWDFDLESSDNCSKDYVALYGGNTTVYPLLGKVCGNPAFPHMKSTTRKILLVFRSDGSGSRNGFKAEFTTECHYSITPHNFIKTAKVSSPNYPHSYPVRYHCEWYFETTPNCTFQLRFYTFHLQLLSSCSSDYVALYDWNTIAGPRLGRFCGNETPPAVTSTAHRMLMLFISDESKTFPGFEAVYSTECFYFVSSTNITVTSPNYSDKYPHDYEGVWKFETNPGYKIKVVFESFNVELGYNAGNCDNDYVKLFDGDSAISENLIGDFCGSEVPHAIISSAHKIFMVFHSNEYEALEGFRATISRDG